MSFSATFIIVKQEFCNFSATLLLFLDKIQTIYTTRETLICQNKLESKLPTRIKKGISVMAFERGKALKMASFSFN